MDLLFPILLCLLLGIAWWPWCCCPEEGGLCRACAGDVPQQIQVVLDGIADDDCSLCHLMKGTFILQFSGEYPPSEEKLVCQWTYINEEVQAPCEHEEHECGYDGAWGIGITLQKSIDDSKYKLWVGIGYSTSTCTCAGGFGNEYPCIAFGEMQEAKFDCLFDGYSVDLSGEGDGGTTCDYSEATCLLTAL